MFSRYLGHMNLEWDNVKPPPTDRIVSYNLLPQGTDPDLLKSLAVLKLNGGLVSSMDMRGAKSALEVKDGLTFLDLTIQQIGFLNTTHQVDIPLLLMTSINTREDTLRVIQKHGSQPVRITSFNQARYPKILNDSFSVCAAPADVGADSAWYPPGHGDLYRSLAQSGILDKLLLEGKEYLFMSSSDNPGACVDARILQHIACSGADFLMEVTDRTSVDLQGGVLVEYKGSLRLLEPEQVPAPHLADFESTRNFKHYSTNNLWINLKSLRHVMRKGMELDVLATNKEAYGGKSILQLETAAGAAIKHFAKTYGVSVPRSRFLPTRTCADLLLIRSDIFTLEHGQLVLNKDRAFGTIPVIKLGDYFRKIYDFQQRCRTIPSIIELDHLTISGNVHFGKNVTLRGTVIIVLYSYDQLFPSQVTGPTEGKSKASSHRSQRPGKSVTVHLHPDFSGLSQSKQSREGKRWSKISVTVTSG